MSSAWVELVVAMLLMYVGGYGLSQSIAALHRGIYLSDVLEQMPCVGVGVMLIFLGSWMGCQALAALHP